MKKKLLAFLVAIACVCTVLPTVAALEQPAVMEAATKKKAPTINKVYAAVKKAYGDDYLPNVRLSKEEIKARYGISSSWYSAAIAEVPMISAHVDTLVIVKAKNADTKKKIKAALKEYRKDLIADTHQYPSNQLKIQASKIYVKGNYVCFFMLGTVNDQPDEGEMIAAYKKENNKAVTAIKKLYK